METKTIKISVTTEDGELLDSITLEVPASNKHVSVRSVNYSLPGRADEEILTLGELK